MAASSRCGRAISPGPGVAPSSRSSKVSISAATAPSRLARSLGATASMVALISLSAALSANGRRDGLVLAHGLAQQTIRDCPRYPAVAADTAAVERGDFRRAG